MTDDEFDKMQEDYDLCGIDGRLRDFAEAVQAAERERWRQALTDALEVGGHLMSSSAYERARRLRDAA